MIRCVRLYTASDGRSKFEDGTIALEAGLRGDVVSPTIAVGTASFRETAPGGKLAWHVAPVRQLVITLSGTLEFETRDAEYFTLRPGDVLLAEDTTGHGHSWRLLDDDPWRRLYVVLDGGAVVPFVAG
jgi:quercetin dioxygenase-like cupin family protein